MEPFLTSIGGPSYPIPSFKELTRAASHTGYRRTHRGVAEPDVSTLRIPVAHRLTGNLYTPDPERYRLRRPLFR